MNPSTGPKSALADDSTVVFLHAHPDDEAIFTGGTMRMLADAGVHVTLICATTGDAGKATNEDDITVQRSAETTAACELLGVSSVRFLGYPDSGIAAEVKNGFAHQPVDPTAQGMVALLEELERPVSAIVVYDRDGIYGHPDHIQVHHVGIRAAELLGVACVYEATVDREYLHFVETHLVVEAGLGERPQTHGLAATHIGRSTLEITTVVDVAAKLSVKQAAMQAHASQLPASAPVFALDEGAFADVYGQEWYIRRGPKGILDELA